MEQATITEVSLVRPALPTRRHQLPFTTFDLMQKRSSMPYLQRVAFYPSADCEDDPDLLITKLKASLAEVLVPFFPFAGRIAFDESGAPIVDCNDAGVEFAVAAIGITLQEIDHSQHLPLFSELIKRGNYEETTMSGTAPFLAFQATKFSCGSLALAWSFDHLFIDGMAMMHFLVSWSELNRSEPLSLLPDHNRWFEMRNESLAALKASTNRFEYKFEDATLRVPVVCRILSLHEDEIQKLKEGTTFTTFEAVAAHLWIALCKARQLPQVQETKVYFAVNCRSKLVPPIPSEYFGNVVLPGITTSTVGELIKGGVHGAASSIRETIRCFGMNEIKSQVEAYKGQKNSMAQGIDDGVDLYMGSSPRHPLYKLDFGFGKPAAVRHVRCLWNGFCFLDPSPLGGKNMDITLYLTPAAMERMEALIKVA